MDNHTLLGLIDSELSGVNSLNWATDLTRFYRSPGASGYHEATRVVEGLFRRSGVDRVWTDTYPLDGHTELMGEAVPLAWEPVSAELREGSPAGPLLMSYDKAYSCLAWWSPSTTEGGETLPIVDVGTGESEADFDGKDIEGKIAFVHGTRRTNGWPQAAGLAMRHGAAGILTDYLLYQDMPSRTRDTLPNAVQLLRMPGSRNTAWGMAVDRPAAERLKAMAASDEHAWVKIETRLLQGEGVNLLAEIEGAGDTNESVLFVTHSTAGTKPAANCASGPALAVEIARTLTSLIASGRVPQPRCTIRFLTDVEGHGSKHYMQTYPNDLKETLAVICLDSVGHSQSKVDSALMYFRCPDSVPTFLNDYVAALIDASPKDLPWVYSTGRPVPAVNFVEHPYTPWSDNKYYPAYGVPAALFMSWPDRYFHTQLLTADNLDPAVFRRCGLVAAAAALGIAGAGPNEAMAIMRDVASRSRFRISQAALKHAADDPARTRRRLGYLASRDRAAIDSAVALAGGERGTDVRAAANALKAEITDRVQSELQWVPAGRRRSSFADGEVVPARKVERSAPGLSGTAYEDLVEITGEMSARDPRFNFHASRIVGDEMWNLTNGERTVNRIAEVIGFEFEYDIDPSHILTLFQGLERAGYVTLNNHPAVP